MEENKNIDREIALEKIIKQLDNIIFKRGQSAQTVHMMTKSKICYDHSTKQAIGFEKPFYLKKVWESKPKLYDGNVILKMDIIVIPDSDETLMLYEQSRLKMLLKEQDPMVVKNKVNTKPINYTVLDNDYNKRFVRQSDLYGEDAYWKATSVTKVSLELLSLIIRTCLASTIWGLSISYARGHTEGKRTRKVSKTSYSASGSQAFRRITMIDIDSANTRVMRRIKEFQRNMCVSNSMNDVKFRAKPKKKKSKREIWKPTGKVFTKMGYIWRPTGRTFTIVGNACPLTRITTTNEVPSRKPIVLESESPKPVVNLVYLRKLEELRSESVSKTEVIKTISANKQEPSKSWGSTKTNVPSTSLNECRLSKSSSDQVAKIMGYGDYQIGNVTISRVYYVEGLGHNLFSVGQFCRVNLKDFRQLDAYSQSRRAYHVMKSAHYGKDPYFGFPIPKKNKKKVYFGGALSDQISLHRIVVINSIVPPDHQVSEHNSKWTKDHPLENIIGETKKIQRSINSKLGWIEAMQEELHEFECLEVWELVSLDTHWFITLKVDSIKLSLMKIWLESCDPLDTPWWRNPMDEELEEEKLLDPSTIVGLWYRRILPFALTAFADADHAGCQDTRRLAKLVVSTTLGDRLVCDPSILTSDVHSSRSMLKWFVDHELYLCQYEYQLADILLKSWPEKELILINSGLWRSFTPVTLKKLADDVED
ncbi:hypothetical protein Tco_1247153 [Tanacetum coccineum]